MVCARVNALISMGANVGALLSLLFGAKQLSILCIESRRSIRYLKASCSKMASRYLLLDDLKSEFSVGHFGHKRLLNDCAVNCIDLTRLRRRHN